MLVFIEKKCMFACKQSDFTEKLSTDDRFLSDILITLAGLRRKNFGGVEELVVKKVRAFIGELASVFAVQVQRGTLRRDAHEPLQFDPRARFRLQPGPPFRLLGPRLRRRQCNARGGTVDPRQERSLDAKAGICKMDARLKIVSKNSS